MSANDINEQINRILSSNIHQDLLSQIPLQLLQSPCIQKSRKQNIQDIQKSNKSSISKSQFEEDLYEKAQQIFKLKTMLEAELTNINQIVDQNQKLTSANTFLTSELKKVKIEFKLFKKNTEDELRKNHLELQQFMLKRIQKEFDTMKKQVHQAKTLKLISSNVFGIYFPQSEILQKKKQEKTKLISQEVKVTINSKAKDDLGNFSKNVNSQTDFEKQENGTINRLQSQIKQLNLKIIDLNHKNIELQEQLSKKVNSTIKQPFQTEKTLRQKNLNSPKINCYSSIFLKSVASEDQNLNQVIRQCLYHSSKSIFEQLEESKYFGKIVSRKKNGKAVEQYKNGFCYEGQFSRNYRHGLGKLFYRQKLVYSGQWYEGKFNGKGLLYSWINLNVQKIQGNFKQGNLHGHGTITFKSGSKLRVCFKGNQIQSEAMLLYNQNSHYSYSHRKSQLGNLIFQNKKYGSDTQVIRFKTKTSEVIQIK